MAAQLHALPVRGREPMPDVIEECEKLLQWAKDGKLRSLTWIGEYHDESGGSYYNGGTGCEDQFLRLGQLTRLVHKAQQAIDQSSTLAPKETS